MAANKVPGVLAAACYTEALARNAREHNDARVLSLGAGHVSLFAAKKIVTTFLATECSAERHRRRVDKILAREQVPVAAVAGALPGGIGPEDLERIMRRVMEIRSGAAPAPGAPAGERTPGPLQIAQMIDHTVLKPEAAREDITKLCREAREYHFFSVCVNPTYVAHAKRELAGSDVLVCAVVGFPLGASPPETKALEARRAIREGAREIDMVINVGAMKSGDQDLVYRDILAVMEACRDGGALLKVILETSLLTDSEKVRVCELAMKAGADFGKTSTGFGSAGATVADIALMARTVAPRGLGVKASGGVKSYDDALAMIRAGATRIGASSGINIVREAKDRER